MVNGIACYWPSLKALAVALCAREFESHRCRSFSCFFCYFIRVSNDTATIQRSLATVQYFYRRLLLFPDLVGAKELQHLRWRSVICSCVMPGPKHIFSDTNAPGPSVAWFGQGFSCLEVTSRSWCKFSSFRVDVTQRYILSPPARRCSYERLTRPY